MLFRKHSEAKLAGTDTARKDGMPIRSRRAQKANQRLQDLTAKYVAEGLSQEDAEARALSELKDNARGDWRAG